MNDDEKELIKGVCYEVLPCSTNKKCTKIEDLKKLIDKVDARTWIILVAIVISIGMQIAFKLKVV